MQGFTDCRSKWPEKSIIIEMKARTINRDGNKNNRMLFASGNVRNWHPIMHMMKVNYTLYAMSTEIPAITQV